MDRKQQKQEDQYRFPYHYVPEWGGGRFTQVQAMRWGYEYASYMEFVVEELLKKKHTPKKLIDVGCGDGRLVYEVRKNIPTVDVSGIDYSAQAVTLARALNSGVTFHVGDIAAPSFAIGIYDTITLVETLEHIPLETIGQFVQGLGRLLEKGGRLIVTVPCSNIPVSKKHYQHFTLESLKETVSSDFILESHYYVNSNSFQEKILKKFLHNRLFSLNKNKLSTWIYRYYKKHLFHSDKNTARRVIGVFVKNN